MATRAERCGVGRVALRFHVVLLDADRLCAVQQLMMELAIFYLFFSDEGQFPSLSISISLCALLGQRAYPYPVSLRSFHAPPPPFFHLPPLCRPHSVVTKKLRDSARWRCSESWTYTSVTLEPPFCGRTGHRVCGSGRAHQDGQRRGGEGLPGVFLHTGVGWPSRFLPPHL